MRLKHLLVTLLAAVVCAIPSHAQILVSGYLANPASTDSPFEYVQLVATQAIDFSVTNFSVVWANNGTATSNGWIAGGAVSYGFNLTSGSVARGGVFYVGGSGKLINGSGSTDISSGNWIRTINTGTTAGDGFGTAASVGVMDNGGGSAGGIAVFTGLTGAITASTTPIDAVFYGTAIGTAKPASGGYTLPDNDRYASAQGTFGNGTNTFLFSDPASAQFTSLVGSFDPENNIWVTARTSTLITLTASSAFSKIDSGLMVVPEPSAYATIFGAVAFGGVVWSRRRRAVSTK